MKTIYIEFNNKRETIIYSGGLQSIHFKEPMKNFLIKINKISLKDLKKISTLTNC